MPKTIKDVSTNMKKLIKNKVYTCSPGVMKIMKINENIGTMTNLMIKFYLNGKQIKYK